MGAEPAFDGVSRATNQLINATKPIQDVPMSVLATRLMVPPLDPITTGSSRSCGVAPYGSTITPGHEDPDAERQGFRKDRGLPTSVGRR
jgi:hypothetical protein